MQFIRFNATTIVTPDAAKPPRLQAAFTYWAEQTEPASIVRIRFYYDTRAHDRGFQVIFDEPLEESLAVDQKLTGWKLGAAWTGAIVGSWALVIACVVIACALQP